jgi:uncharacterized membrane protein (DUF106 family)
MSTIDVRQKAADKLREYRVAIAGLLMAGLVSMASAADLNASVGPILDSVVALFVPLLALILGAVPIIVTLAVIGFILGLLSVILKKIQL